MIHFFGIPEIKVFAVQTVNDLTPETISKLQWLFGDQPKIELTTLNSNFVGPRAAMITPWSTNAVEITQNIGWGTGAHSFPGDSLCTPSGATHARTPGRACCVEFVKWE